MEKKLLSKLMLAMLIALSGIAFTACGDDNDEPENPETPEEATWATKYTVSFELSDDVFKAAEVTAHVVEPDGSRSELTLESSPNLTMEGKKIPDNAAVLLTFVPKKDISETEVYDIQIKGSIRATSYKNGKQFDSQFHAIGGGLTLKGDKVAQYFTGRGVALAYGVDENGKVVTVNTDDIDFGLNNIWKWLAEIIAASDGK